MVLHAFRRTTLGYCTRDFNITEFDRLVPAINIFPSSCGKPGLAESKQAFILFGKKPKQLLVRNVGCHPGQKLSWQDKFVQLY